MVGLSLPLVVLNLFVVHSQSRGLYEPHPGTAKCGDAAEGACLELLEMTKKTGSRLFQRRKHFRSMGVADHSQETRAADQGHDVTPDGIGFAISADGSPESLDLLELVWSQHARSGFHVRAYGGNKTNENSRIELKQLPVPMEEYPPLKLNFHIWDDITRTKNLSWYIRCDADSFVNAPVIQRMLQPLDPNEAWYTGFPCKGYSKDIVRQKINFTYACGGGCEVISKGAAHKIRGRLLKCLDWSLKNIEPPIHSDVEFGRCLSQAGVSYKAKKDLRHIWKMINNGLKDTGQLNGLRLSQMKNVVNKSFGVIHPVKSPEVMMYLRDVEIFGLTPLLDHATPPATSCVHNPHLLWSISHTHCSRHRPVGQHCPLLLPECPSPETLRIPLEGSKGVVVSLDRARSEYKARSIARLFPGVELTGMLGTFGAHRYWFPASGLTSGEMGLRDSMRRALEATDSQHKLNFFLEDDVMLHRDYLSIWKAATSSSRCMGFLSDPGGVLLLGASEYSKWDLIDKEPQPLCYNAMNLTKGTFAFMYSHHVVDTALAWLDHSNEPIDHIWPYLAQRGFPVRVLQPNLFIADITGKSSTKSPEKAVKSKEWLSLPEKMAAHDKQVRWSTEDYNKYFSL